MTPERKELVQERKDIDAALTAAFARIEDLNCVNLNDKAVILWCTLRDKGFNITRSKE